MLLGAVYQPSSLAVIVSVSSLALERYCSWRLLWSQAATEVVNARQKSGRSWGPVGFLSSDEVNGHLLKDSVEPTFPSKTYSPLAIYGFIACLTLRLGLGSVTKTVNIVIYFRRWYFSGTSFWFKTSSAKLISDGGTGKLVVATVNHVFWEL